MKTILVSLAAAAALAIPATAQKMGGVNRNAPKVTNTIEFANGSKVSLTYHSINWAEGQWIQNDQMIQAINANAHKSPLGQVTVTGKAVTLAGQTVQPGKYTMYFTTMTRGDNLVWILNLGKEGSEEPAVRWGLRLNEVDAESKRLRIAVGAGEGDSDFQVSIRFGSKLCEVTGTQASEEKEGDGGN